MDKKYQVRKFGSGTERRDYRKTKNRINIPNLLEVQIESYKKFIETGIDRVFNEIFPIVSKRQDIKVEYIKSGLEKAPFLDTEYADVKLAKSKGDNYDAKLNAKLKITKYNLETGEIIPLNDDSDDEYYFSKIPLMTKGGSFIINGSERIIVSQVIRSPNAYFHDQVGSKTFNQHTFLKSGKIIPQRGSWLDFFYKDFRLMKIEPDDIKIKIESQQFPAIMFFVAMGISTDTIRSLFGSGKNTGVQKLILNSIDSWTKEYTSKQKKAKKVADIADFKAQVDFARRQMYQKLYPNDKIRPNEKHVNYFLGMIFDSKRYDLNLVGRHKLNTKLNVAERLHDKTLAEDVLDAKGKVIYPKDTLMDGKKIENLLKNYIQKDNVMLTELDDLDKEIYIIKDHSNDPDKVYEPRSTKSAVHIIRVYGDEINTADGNHTEERSIITIIGNQPNSKELILTVPDIFATLSYLLNLEDGISSYDDVASLSNRRIRTVGELLENELKVGMLKIEKNIVERISSRIKTQKVMNEKEESTLVTTQEEIDVKRIINPKQLQMKFKEFLNSSQLSQFMDQVNPLSEISNKRRITALGPGGLTRDIAKISLREVNNTHYGRICPIETPEGLNIGLIINFSSYSIVDEYGFLKTPYFKVENRKVSKEFEWLTTDEENRKYIAHADVQYGDDGYLIEDTIVARHKEDLNKSSLVRVKAEMIDLCDVSPEQVFSVATSLIPFLENTDANRALMGANMQRQALPLIWTEAPIVATGMEENVAKFSPATLKSTVDGEVVYYDSKRIDIKSNNAKQGVVSHFLSKFERSNQSTSLNQNPIVSVGQQIKEGELISDGPSINNGELALGKNVMVAFTTWYGYNYEDAIIISERLQKDDVYTSIHIEQYEAICRKTKIGDEEITSEVPNSSKHSKRHLDESGIVRIGSEVKPGDILVGKTTPKGEDDLSPEEKLLNQILGNKAKDKRDSSLRVPHGAEGIVHDIKILSRENGDKLEDDVEKLIKVYIAQKRKIKEGDKMAGRHGNKGVISKVLPIEDMPYLEDGTPIDIILNPLGVPSRMNIGQILELHLGMSAQKLGIKISTPIFNGVDNDSLLEIMKEAGIPESGKMTLYDGRTGDKFDKPVAVGCMYMLKLSHMVDDKIHARSVGSYSLITQQPLGGKSQNGGQRFGEMEAWALEGYGASNLLQEMFTLKSDDIKGRNELFNSISKGRPLPEPSFPESLWVLFYELRGLGLSTSFVDENNENIAIELLNKLT